MQYNNEPINGIVDDIKATASALAIYLFAGLNIIFIIMLGIILASHITIQ
jgi:hypothetical protein